MNFLRNSFKVKVDLHRIINNHRVLVKEIHTDRQEMNQ
jgi:hypothetical protein